MKKLIPVVILITLFSSCRKSESDFIWEKSYGNGEALFIISSSDSSLLASGVSDGNPYFIHLNKNRKVNVEFSGENPGLLSAMWFDTSGYLGAGSSNGKMLLMRTDIKGDLLWEKSIDAGYNVDYTRLFYTGGGRLLAVATAGTDSYDSAPTSILFVRFDTTGTIIEKKKIDSTAFVSANSMTVDNSGNIYLGITRQASGAKPKASVAKYNESFQKLWETELYNNPDFGAASICIKLDQDGNVYVGGKTETAGKDGTMNNSFLVSLNSSGSIRWKKYPESSNSGSSIIFDEMGDLVLLNKNCFIVNILSSSDGADAGRIKMFDVCDPYNTDAFGQDIELDYNNNIFVAGSRGGNFYLALKSFQLQ